MKSQLANRIFRTVVMSGAMLATPLAAQADKAAPPPVKKGDVVKPDAAMPNPDAVKADTWASVNTLMEANTKKLDKAVNDYLKARKAAEKKKTTASFTATALDEVRKERTDLVIRIGKTTRPAPMNEAAWPGVETAETALADAETTLFAAIDAKTETEADFAKNTKAIAAANKSRVSAVAKVKAERTKANKRPRAPVVDRPMGRGFILS
ncbi:MAG: hypothetical protein ACKV2T_43890 [Kofleriaceae bacterium]